jgi:hypothetical protein
MPNPKDVQATGEAMRASMASKKNKSGEPDPNLILDLTIGFFMNVARIADAAERLANSSAPR